jgi:VID27 C-terminal WD40-like domain
VNVATASADGRWLATADRGHVRLWDLVTRECRASIPNREGDTSVRQMMQFTSDGKWLVVSKRWEIFLIELKKKRGGCATA